MTELEQIDARQENGNAMMDLCFLKLIARHSWSWPWRSRTETLAEYTKRKEQLNVHSS